MTAQTRSDPRVLAAYGTDPQRSESRRRVGKVSLTALAVSHRHSPMYKALPVLTDFGSTLLRLLLHYSGVRHPEHPQKCNQVSLSLLFVINVIIIVSVIIILVEYVKTVIKYIEGRSFPLKPVYLEQDSSLSFHSLIQRHSSSEAPPLQVIGPFYYVVRNACVCV